MSESTPGFLSDGRPDHIIIPSTNGREYLEEHQKPEGTPEATNEAIAALRGVHKILLVDLPQNVVVDPELKASTAAYPGIRSKF